jgi:hypothetical protein
MNIFVLKLDQSALDLEDVSNAFQGIIALSCPQFLLYRRKAFQTHSMMYIYWNLRRQPQLCLLWMLCSTRGI